MSSPSRLAGKQVMIPFEDFGGAGPLLHFAHANGFPPRAYRPLIDQLTPHFHVVAAHARPLWPAAGAPSPEAFRDWSLLTRDLIQFLDQQKLHGLPGVGHSMGAVSTLDAALRRPDLFRALVLIDPVILRRRLLWAWEVVRGLGLGDRLHPLIPGTLRRQRVFPSLEAMFARYRRARALRGLDDRALRHYVEAVARPLPEGGVALGYSPEWEATIYRRGPLNVWNRLPTLARPLLVIYGAGSDAFPAASVRKMRRLLPQAQFVKVPGAGHLVPLEKPAEVGAAILKFLNNL